MFYKTFILMMTTFMIVILSIHLANGDCSSPFKTGQCKASKVRYYCNASTGRCETFIYGGCGGNDNNYKTEDDCYTNCKTILQHLSYTFTGNMSTNKLILLFIFVIINYLYMVDLLKLDCISPAVTGMCKAYIRRWYCNPSTGRCEQFVYSGCGGNGNNYRNETECYNCQSLPFMGNCKAHEKRWYCNPSTGRCEPFVYGGCGGNGNNYYNESQCYFVCNYKSGCPNI
ncbi:boophilin-H2-like [Oppia nitens]|uniref:boophilin-H2-like n=1 Tax=Oppia nitens TaxID=1686743 RepID=UPI0023DBF13E|nr:boophilin-H2-like [Oppia nitens]